MAKVNLRTVLKLIIGGFGLVLIIGGIQDIIYFNPYVAILVGFFAIIVSKVV